MKSEDVGEFWEAPRGQGCEAAKKEVQEKEKTTLINSASHWLDLSGLTKPILYAFTVNMCKILAPCKLYG
jgi:hypothetical protein